MVIGVIDTGVDVSHSRLVGHEINGLSIRKDADNKFNYEESIIDGFGHGTGVVSIIANHINDIRFFVVKVAEYQGTIGEDVVAKAIDYLVNNTDAGIINISMGIKTNNPSIALEKSINDAFNNKVIVVASSYYNNKYDCYPANFSTVISVGSGYIKSKKEFKFLENKKANVLAKGGFQRVAIPGNNYKFSVGTSLATAHFTGIIASSFANEEWSDYNTLMTWLKENSNNRIFSLTRHDVETTKNVLSDSANEISVESVRKELELTSDVHNVALFPIEEKEMQSICENLDSFSFNLTLVIGYPRILKNSLKTIEGLDCNFTNKEITEEQYQSFDTIAVGYFTEQQADYNTIYALHLVKECLIRNKNIIVWDRPAYKIIKEIAATSVEDYTGNLYFVSFDNKRKKTLYNFIGTHYSDRKPSLCIIGTNKKQGKFTVQLTVKKILNDFGYKVSHISTEPQGILLGAEAVFPIGHHSTVSINIKEWYHSISSLKKWVTQRSNPDIIITGSQSGILPKYPVYTSLPPEKLIYVNAFYPDALICTISPDDTVEFINKTVNTVTSYTNSKVLFYCLTPFIIKPIQTKNGLRLENIKLDASEYREKLEFFSKNLSASVFDIKDHTKYESILCLIQNYYSDHEHR